MNDNGGPAFPSLEIFESWNDERGRHEVNSNTATGMSLRDYFAAAALIRYDAPYCADNDMSYSELAGRCYRLADAMLKAREQS